MLVMAKVIILGDLHFGVRNCNDAIFFHQKKFFGFLFDYMEKNGITKILQLGDTWDSRRTINFRALDFAYTNFFDVLKAKGYEYHTLIGNHDIFYRDALDIHSPRLLLKNYDNVFVYDKPCSLDVDGCKFDIIPWICEENREECLKAIEQSDSDYCLGHFEIGSFEVVHGVDFVGGLEPSFFSRFKMVFSGHFHQRSRKENICYVGTPYEITWGDVYRSKGFIVFDTENKKEIFVENPDKYFLEITYDDSDNKIPNLKDYNLANCFVKLLIKKKNEPYAYNVFVSKLYAQNPADVKFIESSNLEGDAVIDVDVNSLKMEDVIKKYVEEKTSYGDKESLKGFLLKLYNEALLQSEKDVL